LLVLYSYNHIHSYALLYRIVTTFQSRRRCWWQPNLLSRL